MIYLQTNLCSNTGLQFSTSQGPDGCGAQCGLELSLHALILARNTAARGAKEQENTSATSVAPSLSSGDARLTLYIRKGEGLIARARSCDVHGMFIARRSPLVRVTGYLCVIGMCYAHRGNRGN